MFQQNLRYFVTEINLNGVEFRINYEIEKVMTGKWDIDCTVEPGDRTGVNYLLEYLPMLSWK